MVELLTLFVICGLEKMGKSFIAFCKIGWWFIKIGFWLIFVLPISIASLMVVIFGFIVCKIAKRSTPRLMHTKIGMLYPMWNN